MPLEALTSMPAHLNAGTTWKILRSYTNFPASAGWVVTFYFVNSAAAPFNVAASAVGDDHLIEVSAANSASKAAGLWYYRAEAVKAGEIATAEEGQVQIHPNFATISAASDQRSFNRKMLDAIQTTLLDRSSSPFLETEVNTGSTNRRLKYLTHAELMAVESRYKFLVAQEENTQHGRSNIRLARFN